MSFLFVLLLFELHNKCKHVRIKYQTFLQLFFIFFMNTTLPPVNQRIYDLIREKSKGNVSQFCKKLGIEKPQKINRLFKADKRSGKYPTPSSDILTLISNTFDIPLDEIVKGKRAQKSFVAEESQAAPYGTSQWLDPNLSPMQHMDKIYQWWKDGFITDSELEFWKSKIKKPN